MPVVDLIIATAPTASQYKDQFVVELQFSHDDDSLTTDEEIVFAGNQKAEVIDFVNAARAIGDFTEQFCREPEEGEDEEEIVAMYEKWFNYSKPGMSSWPTDSNGDYYGRLDYLGVVYYDANGVRFAVEEVQSD